MTWKPSRLPRQDGRIFVITGANAGLGYFTAEQLAGTGARVVIASRNRQKSDAAIASIRARVPDSDLGYLELDLASLASVRRAGDEIARWERLDGLVLNAGITTGSRRRQTTEDGLELTLGTNYLGHFALAARAWPALARTPGSRIVGLGSLSTRLVRLDGTDLQSERRFGFFRAYGFSKHAVQGFIIELDRRLRGAGVEVSAVLAHPGFALEGLSSPRPGIVNPTALIVERALAFAAQGKNQGAASIVRALLDPAVSGGEYIGPKRLVNGRPERLDPVSSSASPKFGRELWRLSEQWTAERFRP